MYTFVSNKITNTLTNIKNMAVNTPLVMKIDYAESLRQMSVNSVIICSAEEKDGLRVAATRLKKTENKIYSIKKNRITKRYTVTRLS